MACCVKACILQQSQNTKIHATRSKNITLYRDMNRWGDPNNGVYIKPIIRSTYRRTVYQDSNGADVRISFDEDV